MELSIFDEEDVIVEQKKHFAILIKWVQAGLNNLLFFCGVNIVFECIKKWNNLTYLIYNPLIWVSCLVFILAISSKYYCNKAPLLAIILPSFFYLLILAYELLINTNYSIFYIFFTLLILYYIIKSIVYGFKAQKILNQNNFYTIYV